MKKILIANRGEIACRIINSCKKLGLQSIAVYSDIDKNSKHVREADESIHIGGSKAQESYLLPKKIIEVAKKLSADAIHPGYGFMAENAEFAQNVIDSGIIWIGPKPETIISMGNKDIARELAIKNNLPICPGLKDEDLKKDDLEKKCNEIGYPILIKASAGGGGIGMQIANNYEDLVKSIEKTKNLAKKAFGNSDIFLEKFISNARHIEIQVFGLGERKALHFYERDCSIQRRFQKIIEESPAPQIEKSIIDEMAENAVKFVTSQKYEGAGTIEFIYDIDNKKFFFLEMNTRIQVEHPVTEMITNSDLVSMQIQFALNLDIESIEQNKINKIGHAIECRLYAEDPSKNFLPSPGKITKLNLPNTGLTNIRLDIGVDVGDEISFYYDPMIAKIISKSENRTESINNMVHYLSELEIEGINTNKSFLISVLKNENFENANYNTKFIENNLSLFTKKIETVKKNDGNTQKKEKVVQKYTDNDVEAFKKIAAQTPKAKSSENYTEKDFKAFKNILNNKNDTNKKTSINNMVHYLSELEIEGINTNKSFLISVLKNENFENANYNTKFIENNLSLFTKKIETVKKNDGNTQKKEKVVQKYTDNDVEAFKKIAAQTPKAKSSENYTEKDFKAFKNILNNKDDNNKKTSINNITGRVYDEPIIKPGGDKYMVIEFGNLMDLEINFKAQNLAKAILDNKIKGIYETAPCFASMLIHYNPEEIKFSDLKNEMKSLINSLGPTDNIEINSRIFSFPTVYLDKWTKECIEDYSSKIAEKTPDPDFIVELNKLENTDQFVRVHSGTEYWVSALGFWPGLPFMMPLDPRCKLTAPKYNPPRTWTPKGAVGMGGSSTAIYPDRLPGGYQIFGIIPVPIWDTYKSFSVFEESICLFKPGDRVKFIPTSYEEFDHVSNKVKDKSYDYNIIDYQKFSVKNYKNWLKTIDKTKRF